MDTFKDYHSYEGDYELTDSSADDLSPRLNPFASSTTFTFPALSLDGSVQARRYSTPPAALSSLGAKMARNLSDSFSSLDDGSYDMVDDISEISSDGHDTVSIASTTDQDDEMEEMHITERLSPILMAEQQAFKVPMPYHENMGIEASQDVKQLSQSSVADLETPKQSVMDDTAHSSQLTERAPHSIPSRRAKPSWADIDAAAEKSARSPAKLETHNGLSEKINLSTTWDFYYSPRDFVPSSRHLLTGLAIFGLIYLCNLLSIYSGMIFMPYSEMGNRTNIMSQRISSISALNDHAKALNYTHLVPERVPIGTDFLGFPYYGTREVRYQVVDRFMLVSLPELRPEAYLRTAEWRLHRGSKLLLLTIDYILPGITLCTLSPDDAHGLVELDMTVVGTGGNITITHDFGNRFLHGSTYQKASKDISKAITKDIAVARDVAKSIGTTLQPDISGRLRNVSLMLRSAATDLTIFVNKTTTSIHKAEQESKDLAVRLEHDLMVFGKDLQHIFSSAVQSVKALVPTMKIVTEPLLLSRERALTISQLLAKKKELRSKARKERLRIKQNRASVKADTKALRREHKPKCKKAKVSVGP